MPVKHLVGKMTQCLQDGRSLAVTKTPPFSKQSVHNFQPQSIPPEEGGWGGGSDLGTRAQCLTFAAPETPSNLSPPLCHVLTGGLNFS